MRTLRRAILAAGATSRLFLILGWVFGTPAWAGDAAPAGGALTTTVTGPRAYSQFSPALSFIEQGHFKRGDFLFRGARPDVGPLFNETSCQGCHVHDGRGQPPATPGEPMASTFLRLSVPGDGGTGGVVPEPTYGDQLQTFATEGPGEGWGFITYEPVTGEYADGTAFSLRQPVYHVRELRDGPLHPQVMMSPRTAPPVFGLGLIEALPEAALVGAADPDDADGDGISGRVNRVWDVATNRWAVGRFGYKAGNPSLLQQLAGAFRGDMGVTNPLFPDPVCTPVQAGCATDAAPKTDALTLALVEFYSRTLAVPERRNTEDPAVRAGEVLFSDLGCAGCHTPTLVTGEAAGSVLGTIEGLMLGPVQTRFAPTSGQTIYPYTDVLLHDMGGDCQPVSEADGVFTLRCTGLADGRPEYDATGREWRTAPLWGIGLAQAVNPRAGFLHDGRARTLAEAILWHGGEADAAREGFRTLAADDRARLIAFLESL